MKKKIVGVATLATFLISCSKNAFQKNVLDPGILNEDKEFVELITETYQYILLLSNQIQHHSLALQDVQKQLNILESKGGTYEQQMSGINDIFKGNISTVVSLHIRTYQSLWPKIKIKYRYISQDVLENECSEVINSISKIKEQSAGTYSYTRPNNASNISSDNISNASPIDTLNGALVPAGCSWRYTLCVAAATAGAILCHGACETTAIATTAGLGIPACIVACGALQAYAIVQCHDNYCGGIIAPVPVSPPIVPISPIDTALIFSPELSFLPFNPQ